MGHSPYQLDFFSINSLSFPSSIAAQALQGLGIYQAIHWPYRLGRWPEGTHLLRKNQTNRSAQQKPVTRWEDDFIPRVGFICPFWCHGLVVFDVSFWKKKHIHSHPYQKEMEISKKIVQKPSCSSSIRLKFHPNHLPKPPSLSTG